MPLNVVIESLIIKAETVGVLKYELHLLF